MMRDGARLPAGAPRCSLDRRTGMFEGAIALGLVPVMLGLGGDSAGVVWAVMIALGVAILRRRSERPCVPRAIARGGSARTTGPR